MEYGLFHAFIFHEVLIISTHLWLGLAALQAQGAAVCTLVTLYVFVNAFVRWFVGSDEYSRAMKLFRLERQLYGDWLGWLVDGFG